MSGSLRLSPVSAVLDHFRPGRTVFVPGISGESLALFDALRAEPQRADGVIFVGVHFSGINRTDYLGLHPNARQRAYFMSPSVRAGLASGRADLLPLDYPSIVRNLDTSGIDVAVAQVSPPDAAGLCGLGVCYDFLPSVWANARLRVAHVNPRLPRTRGSWSIRASDCHVAFEADAPLPTLADEAPDEVSAHIAARVAALVDDGATLQFGVGRLQSAILRSLADHRRLRIHSGMVSAPVIALLDAGAIGGEAAIETGVALGPESFYARLECDPTFYFRPVRETHDVRRIAQIPRFCAINSAIEVDLFGQVTVDCLDGRWVAGVGGLPAFAAGAQLSPGGRSVVVLPSTGNKGAVSRIVAAASAPSLIALPRHLGDILVTEHGVANLRDLGVSGRARALIDIAAPQFREGLAARWRQIEAGL
jgi:acyl-CoA hydrolase